jgi:hypothetical protein
VEARRGGLDEAKEATDASLAALGGLVASPRWSMGSRWSRWSRRPTAGPGIPDNVEMVMLVDLMGARPRPIEGQRAAQSGRRYCVVCRSREWLARVLFASTLLSSQIKRRQESTKKRSRENTGSDVQLADGSFGFVAVCETPEPFGAGGHTGPLKGSVVADHAPRNSEPTALGRWLGASFLVKLLHTACYVNGRAIPRLLHDARVYLEAAIPKN